MMQRKSDKTLIKVSKLAKVYPIDGTIGLDRADIEIKEGESIAIIGPSGSGKSTLLQILGCLDRPTSGQYFLQGKEIQHYTDDELAEVRSSMMGFVFQSFNLLPRLSVIENIKIPLIYAEVPEPKRTEIAKKMVDMVGLKDRTHLETNKLSGGEKQRVAIARALVNDPKIVFADEPTGSLDSKSGATILDFLEELHKQGRTIVVVTHESYVAKRAHRIIHIKDGRVYRDEENGDPSETVMSNAITR